MDRLFTNAWHFRIDEDYDWIEELGVQKRRHLPALERVNISEHSCNFTEGVEHDPNRVKRWDVPESLERVFQRNSIELEIWVRMWYNFDVFGEEAEDENAEGFVFTPSLKRSS